MAVTVERKRRGLRNGPKSEEGVVWALGQGLTGQTWFQRPWALQEVYKVKAVFLTLLSSQASPVCGGF